MGTANEGFSLPRWLKRLPSLKLSWLGYNQLGGAGLPFFVAKSAMRLSGCFRMTPMRCSQWAIVILFWASILSISERQADI